MQNFKFDFLENEFPADWGVCFKFYENFFSKGFFSLYRGILELKRDISIMHKNHLFANKTCCGLTTLFVKMKIYFCCYNFANKQIKNIPNGGRMR